MLHKKLSALAGKIEVLSNEWCLLSIMTYGGS
jgi:hypothetical protein